MGENWGLCVQERGLVAGEVSVSGGWGGGLGKRVEGWSRGEKASRVKSALV